MLNMINFVQKNLIECHETFSNSFLLFSVDKYKTEEEKTLTRKISKLNMHSIGKKSTRIGQRFLSSIGIESTVKLIKNLFFLYTAKINYI